MQMPENDSIAFECLVGGCASVKNLGNIYEHKQSFI